MILASAASAGPASSEPSPRYPDALDCLPLLDNITFYIIEIETGRLTCSKVYNNDYIYLNNMAGVHLYGEILGIVSVKNQCIYLLNIDVLLNFY